VSQQGRLTMAKRDRERQVAERRKLKAAERAENRQRPASSQRDSSVDPDIAGIVAGPQPLQDWQRADEE